MHSSSLGSAKRRVYFRENFPKEVTFDLELARWTNGEGGRNFRLKAHWWANEREGGRNFRLKAHWWANERTGWGQEWRALRMCYDQRGKTRVKSE